MKKIVLSTLFSVIATLSISAQSYFAQQQGVRFFKTQKGAAPNSLWFGSQATYQISSNPEFADNFTPMAKGFYEITTFKIGKKDLVLPSVFNLGMMRSVSSDFETKKEEISANLQDIANSSQGINIGLNPYYKIIEKENGFTITLHSLLSGKINSFTSDSIDVKYLLQGRFSLGADLTIGEEYPLTFSFSPVYSIFDSKIFNELFDEGKSELFSFETSIIIPIGSGVGGVVDLNFGKDIDFAWGFGVVFAVR